VKNQILVNSIQTPDGTILTSYSIHDYKTHKDELTGETYMVDGGTEYIRRNLNKVPAVDWCIYSNDSHIQIRNYFTWGTYGTFNEDGKYIPKVQGSLRRVLLKDLETDHIQAILETQHHISEKVVKVFTDELKYRKENED